jgi:phosphatidate cytidylyltransferase
MLRARIITALVMLAVLYWATALLSAFHFTLGISLALVVAILEWTKLMGLQRMSLRVVYVSIGIALMLLVAWGMGITSDAINLSKPIVLAVCGTGVLFWLWAFSLMRGYPDNIASWSTTPITALIGFLTLIPTWAALVQLKYLEPNGYLVFALIAMVSIADIGAYFVGRAFGKSKLAPQLSPGKSWAGFWGGVLSCGLLSISLLYLLNHFIAPLDVFRSIGLIVLMLIVAVFSVMGDLFESMFKRNQGLKDSGSILPGHGGILDRIDSLTAAAPLFVCSLLVILGDVAWV